MNDIPKQAVSAKGGLASSRSQGLAPAARTPKRNDPLSATLASGALARLAIDFAVHPEEAPHGRALQRRAGLTPRSLQAEVARLERLGIVQRRKEGRQVHYEVNEGNPRWRALRELVREFADPLDVLGSALADVPGIATAFIFGSFARGDVRPDSDIDLFILDDDVDEDRLARRTLDAGVLLRREVNVVQMTPTELARRLAFDGGFARELVRGPKLWVTGDQDEFDSRVATAKRLIA